MTVDIELPNLQSLQYTSNKQVIRKSNMKHKEFESLGRRFVIKVLVMVHNTASMDNKLRRLERPKRLDS